MDYNNKNGAEMLVVPTDEPKYKQLTKMCSCCHEVKPVSEFHRAGKGYQAYCKDCKSERNKANALARKVEGRKTECESLLSNISSRTLLEEIKRRGYRWEKMSHIEYVDFDKI